MTHMAFSLTKIPPPTGPSCSETHIPGYINSAATKTAGDVYVVSVNDAFVMKAWGKNLDPEGKSKVRAVACVVPRFVFHCDCEMSSAMETKT